jgi:CrcB protein
VSAALLVFVGGGLGSLARYGVGRWLGPAQAGSFPWSTFAVNVAGSLLLGALAGWSVQREVGESARAFLAIGLLGGFTTYSSFNAETLALFGQRGVAAAGGYVLATVVACLAAGLAGAAAARALAGS